MVTGRAKEATRGISINDLQKDDGADEIMKILDKIFQGDETTQAHPAVKDYVKYRLSSDEFFIVVVYEKRYREVKCCKLDLPTRI